MDTTLIVVSGLLYLLGAWTMYVHSIILENVLPDYVPDRSPRVQALIWPYGAGVNLLTNIYFNIVGFPEEEEEED